jgi:hypothetical protein
LLPIRLAEFDIFFLSKISNRLDRIERNYQDDVSFVRTTAEHLIEIDGNLSEGLTVACNRRRPRFPERVR